MKNTAQGKTLIIMILLLLCCVPASAQFDNPDEDEDPSDAPLNPAAPIDGYTLPMLLLGAVTGYCLVTKTRVLDRKRMF